jgi:cellulose synthase (UDP-forming)
MRYYFDTFEDRTLPQPVPYSMPRELLWQFLATVNLVLGARGISSGTGDGL